MVSVLEIPSFSAHLSMRSFSSLVSRILSFSFLDSPYGWPASSWGHMFTSLDFCPCIIHFKLWAYKSQEVFSNNASDGNQIFPGLLSALSVYCQDFISGFLISLKCINGVFICFSGKCQRFSILSFESSGNQNLLQ